MTSTDSITTAPAVAPKKGKGRKIAVIAGVAATLLIGVLIGKAGGSSTATAAPTPEPVTITTTVQAPPVTVQAPPVTVQAAAPAPVTVTAPPPAPVTVTAAPAAPAAPAAGKAPGDPKKNGNYLIGSQIEGGTWQCDNPSSLPYWSVKSEANELLDNGIESIATIQEGFKAELSGCNSIWTKV